MKMRLLIFTEGGQDIGFGHITRCMALCQAFAKMSVTSHMFINGDETVKSLLKGINYSVFNWLVEREKAFKEINKTDIVIVDSYLADLEFYKKVSTMALTPVYIDDNKRLNYPRGIVVNGSIHAHSLNYPINNGNIYLLGTRYLPLRKEFWNIPNKKIKMTVEDVLITFGGGNHVNFVKRIIKFLSKTYPDFAYHVITTVPVKLNNHINFRFYTHLSALKMRNLMLECDLCISGGGQTLYELARIGLPTIGICFAENQKKNLEAWHEKGVIEYAGYYGNNDIFSNLFRTFDSLVKYQERCRRSQISKETVDGGGVRRIVDRLMKNLHS